jgi:hypothetical protein
MVERWELKHIISVWVLLGMICLGTSQADTLGAQTSRTGTLHIDGASIDRLVLQGDAGQPQVFPVSEPNLVLPEGSYHLQEVTLQGGYSCRGLEIPAAARVVKIGPGAATTLKLGAPLRQTVKVERWGASLVLNYLLLGRGGESYTVTRRQASKPPAFAVYRGERQVASGAFEPG